ncbi:MAG: winged helix-turn-helix domain-containing protein [Myxococcota bacterium]
MTDTAAPQIDLVWRLVLTSEREHRLTSREAAVLGALIAARGGTLSRDQLLAAGWGDGGSDHALTVLIGRLRAKLEVDPARPVHLLTRLGEGYAWIGAATPGASAPARSIPAAVASVVGRDEEAATLSAAVRPASLTTLTGPPGVGKTTLALLLARSHHAAVFVDLTCARTLSQVVSTLARALEVQLCDGPILAALRTLAASTEGRLVVLDNCEQVAEAAATVAEALLSAGGAIVVTSRRPLGLGLERCHSVPPLAHDAARALFVERATSVADGFVLADDEVPLLADLVERLERLPLAIEPRGVPPRCLLPARRRDAARGAPRRLEQPGARSERAPGEPHRGPVVVLGAARPRVTTGSRSMQCVRGGVLRRRGRGGARSEGAPILPALQTLHAHSLLASRDADGRRELALLVPIRAWAATRLSSADTSALRTRHQRFFAHWIARVEDERRTLVRALPDLRAALAWPGASETTGRLARGLEFLLRWSGAVSERLEVLEVWAQTAQRAADRHVLVDVLCRRSMLLVQVGHAEEAMRLASQAAALDASDPRTHYTLAMLHFRQGLAEQTIAECQQVLALDPDMGQVFQLLTWALGTLGRCDEARAYAERNLARYRVNDEPIGAAAALVDLASLATDLGELEQAEALFGEAQRLIDSLVLQRLEASTLPCLARLRLAQGRPDEALAALERARALYAQLAIPDFEAVVRGERGLVEADRGAWGAAANTFEAAYGCVASGYYRPIFGLHAALCAHLAGQPRRARAVFDAVCAVLPERHHAGELLGLVAGALTGDPLPRRPRSAAAVVAWRWLGSP